MELHAASTYWANNLRRSAGKSFRGVNRTIWEIIDRDEEAWERLTGGVVWLAAPASGGA
jgi:hypothetical protein